MNRQRYITVPLDKEAMDLYDMGEEVIENSLQWLLAEEEFDTLNNADVFKQINNICDVIIDDYESETIQGNNLEKAYKIICLFYDENPSSINEKLKTYIKTALDENTLIAFDF